MAMPIALQQVTVFRGGAIALTVERLDFAQCNHALVGPNGSGKSTLLHVIAGLIKPTSGEVRVFGQPPDTVRPRIGYVLQHQNTNPVLPITAREAVMLGRAPHLGPFRPPRRADRAAVDTAMERLEVTDLANRQMSELSGGQRQRVLIAQGLAQQADVLLLDEPTAAVDVASVDTIRNAIAEERAGGRTIVVTTHDLGDAATYDHVTLLAQRVVATGAPGDVLTPERLSEAYAGRLLRIDSGQIALDDGSHHHYH